MLTGQPLVDASSSRRKGKLTEAEVEKLHRQILRAIVIAMIALILFGLWSINVNYGSQPNLPPAKECRALLGHALCPLVPP